MFHPVWARLLPFGETIFVKQVIPLVRLVQTRLLVIFTLCVFTFFATRSLGLSELFLVPGLLFCALQSVLVFGGSTVHEKNVQNSTIQIYIRTTA